MHNNVATLNCQETFKRVVTFVKVMCHTDLADLEDISVCMPETGTGGCDPALRCNRPMSLAVAAQTLEAHATWKCKRS